MAATAQGAWAADLPEFPDLSDDTPILRGGITDGLSNTSVNWQGFYVGGHVGYSSANMDFSNATQSLTTYMLQNTSLAAPLSGWTVLGKTSPVSPGFGGFVGYNGQWDDVIVGIEANYTRMSNLTGSQANDSLPSVNIPAGCIAVPTGDTDVCGAKLSGAASATVTDVMTLRGRGGYAIGNFLPYMFGGLALGRADVTRNATVVQNDSVYNTTTTALVANYQSTFSQSQPNNGVFTYGYTAGLGVEALVWGGLFARAEYEYVKFVSVKDINIQINTVRAGLGYKF
jgi:opacity protein-like surface antigen